MTERRGKRVLLLAYGNPAREDDGLGPAAAEVIEELNLNNLTVDSDYQLTVEDAATVAEHDAVVFVDASLDCEGPFTFKEVAPSLDESFSTHSVQPETVVGMAKQLFGAIPEAYILGIRGYSFDMFKEEMTKKAVENMGKAISFLLPVLETGNFSQALGK